MKKLIVLSLIIFGINCYGQQTGSKIEIKKKLGTVFVRDGKTLSPNLMIEIMKDNPNAFKEMQIAKKNYGPGLICSFSGGFLVGFSLPYIVMGGKSALPFTFLGAGLIVTSIPFNSAYVKHAKNAVGIYNNGLKSSGLNRNYDLRFVFAGNGAGIRLTF